MLEFSLTVLSTLSLYLQCKLIMLQKWKLWSDQTARHIPDYGHTNWSKLISYLCKTGECKLFTEMLKCVGLLMYLLGIFSVHDYCCLSSGYDQGGGYLNSPNVGTSQQQPKVFYRHYRDDAWYWVRHSNTMNLRLKMSHKVHHIRMSHERPCFIYFVVWPNTSLKCDF